MTRYVSVLYYCDHVGTSHRICNNKAIGHEDTIGPAETSQWLFAGGKHYCPGHKAEHIPAPPKRPRRAVTDVQPTLDDLAVAVTDG